MLYIKLGGNIVKYFSKPNSDLYDERKKIIPEYLYNVPNTISFSELMNSDDKYALIVIH
jgi:hypothetical protein